VHHLSGGVQATQQDSVIGSRVVRARNWRLCLLSVSPFLRSPSSRLPCFHYFHDRCIKAWLRRHMCCPECFLPMNARLKDDKERDGTVSKESSVAKDAVKRQV